MRTLIFAKRVSKEIIRDPITVFFGIFFPLVILLLMSAIQKNVPVSIFEIESLAPGIAVFGLSFFALFSAMIISKDRMSSFTARLFTTPLKAHEFILGYTLPMLAMAMVQLAAVFIVSIPFGLRPSVYVLLTILSNIPTALFFISTGLLLGSLLNDKQVGGICGALLTNICAFLSGAWIDVALIGGGFETVARLLPFIHATEAGRMIIGKGAATSDILVNLIWVMGYAVLMTVAAIAVFCRKMRRR